MSDQGRPKHQHEPLDPDRGGFAGDEEKARLALAKLRLLSDQEQPLSLEQAIGETRRLHETYERWVQSKLPLKDIEVRLSGGATTSLTRIRGRQCEMRFDAAPPPGAVLAIWKDADAEFLDEVLLLKLSLSGVSTEGLTVEKSYPNGQSLSLRVERCPGGGFSISAEVTEPRSLRHASALRFNDLLPWLRMRPAYALATLALVMLAVNLSLFNGGFGDPLNPGPPGLARETPEVIREGSMPAPPQEVDSTRGNLATPARNTPRARESALKDMAPTPRRRSVETSHAERAPAIISFNLAAYSKSRGASGDSETRVLRVNESTVLVRFAVQLFGDMNAKQYDVSLSKVGGGIQFRQLILRSGSPDGKYLAVDVPAQLLRDGDYILRVSGGDAMSGTDEVLGLYEFRVVAKERPGRKKGGGEARPAGDLPPTQSVPEPANI